VFVVRVAGRGGAWLAILPPSSNPQTIFEAVLNEQIEKWEKMGSKLSSGENDLHSKRFWKGLLHKWLPADALRAVIVCHLPTPNVQAYRADTLYNGEEEDHYFTRIHDCGREAPLRLYISKYESAGKSDVNTKSVRRTLLMGGRYQEPVEYIPAGNWVRLLGVDHSIVTTTTSTADGEFPYPLTDMKSSVSPVVRVAVEPRNMQELPTLVEGLKRLSKSNPLVQCSLEETGEHSVAGELQVEISLKDLQADFMEDFAEPLGVEVNPPVPP
jgi:elongation factor 2